jgi:hypothetical protein
MYSVYKLFSQYVHRLFLHSVYKQSTRVVYRRSIYGVCRQTAYTWRAQARTARDGGPARTKVACGAASLDRESQQVCIAYSGVGVAAVQARLFRQGVNRLWWRGRESIANRRRGSTAAAPGGLQQGIGIRARIGSTPAS